MCNEVARRIALDLVREDFSQLRIKLVFPEGLPNLAAAASVRITDRTLIVRQAPEPEAVVRRWSWSGPTGKPVFNYRAEGRRFAQGRCLVVADAMFEFTQGSAKKKDKWRFTARDAAWFGIAGLWRADVPIGKDGRGEAFTMLTCDAGPDIAPYHGRQVVVLPRDAWARWLDPDASDVGDLLVPSAAGSFDVAPA